MFLLFRLDAADDAFTEANQQHSGRGQGQQDKEMERICYAHHRPQEGIVLETPVQVSELTPLIHTHNAMGLQTNMQPAPSNSVPV